MQGLVLEDCSSERLVVLCVVLLLAAVVAPPIQHLQVPPILPQGHPARNGLRLDFRKVHDLHLDIYKLRQLQVPRI